jgi:hypothetical protein
MVEGGEPPPSTAVGTTREGSSGIVQSIGTRISQSLEFIIRGLPSTRAIWLSLSAKQKTSEGKNKSTNLSHVKRTIQSLLL